MSATDTTITTDSTISTTETINNSAVINVSKNIIKITEETIKLFSYL